MRFRSRDLYKTGASWPCNIAVRRVAAGGGNWRLSKLLDNIPAGNEGVVDLASSVVVIPRWIRLRIRILTNFYLREQV